MALVICRRPHPTLNTVSIRPAANRRISPIDLRAGIDHAAAPDEGAPRPDLLAWVERSPAIQTNNHATRP